MRHVTPLFLIFLCLCTNLSAQTNSVLWRISGPAIAPSYLFGTVHSRDARAYAGNDSLWSAFAACERVVGELDNQTAAAAAMKVMASMLLAEDQALASLFATKEQADSVSEAVRSELGPMASMTARMRPFWVVAMLSENIMRKDSALVLDDFVQQKARADGKEVLGLETIDDQLDAVNAISVEEQAEMLLDMVRHDMYRDQMERMLNAYAAQDLAQVMRIAQEGGMPEQLDKELLTERNSSMSVAMDSLLRSGPSCFFAIGAAHLPGELGVITKLRQLGWRVDPVAPVPVSVPVVKEE